MRVQSSTRYVAFAALMGALACAGNKVRTDEAAAARDTSSTRDTLGGETQNPPGYRGMERVDTTSGAASQRDTSGMSGMGMDSTGMSGMGMDSTRMRSDSAGTSGATGLDSTGMSRSGDTTGYSPSQQSRDTTSR